MSVIENSRILALTVFNAVINPEMPLKRLSVSKYLHIFCLFCVIKPFIFNIFYTNIESFQA